MNVSNSYTFATTLISIRIFYSTVKKIFEQKEKAGAKRGVVLSASPWVGWKLFSTPRYEFHYHRFGPSRWIGFSLLGMSQGWKFRSPGLGDLAITLGGSQLAPAHLPLTLDQSNKKSSYINRKAQNALR